MSQDPAINSAILNYMAKVGGGSSSGGGAQVPADRPTEDYEWLRQAMAAVESPERKLKKMLTFVDACNAEMFEKGSPVTGPVVAPKAAAPGGKAAAAPPRVEVLPEESANDETQAPPSAPKQGNEKEAEGESSFASAEEKNDFLLATLEELSDMVEDINWAMEFALMGGPAIVLRFLKNICDFTEQELRLVRSLPQGTATTAASATPASAEEGEPSSTSVHAREAFKPVLVKVEALLCMVVAHAAQLNEKLQNEFLTHKWYEVLSRVLSLEIDKEAHPSHGKDAETQQLVEGLPTYAKPSAQVVAAGLHACSSLCRDSPANTVVFLKSGGMELLVSLLRFTDAASASATPSSRPSFLSNKILARIFFFAAYLAESGLSAEELIELICKHTEVPQPASSRSVGVSTSYGVAEGKDDAGADDETAGDGVDEAAARASATALLALTLKSPKVVKGKVKSLMPKRLKRWGTEINDVEDPRRRLVDELEKVS